MRYVAAVAIASVFFCFPRDVAAQGGATITTITSVPEAGVNISTWSLLNGEPATSGGVWYGRTFRERAHADGALEMAVDVARAQGESFGTVTLQLRARERIRLGSRYAITGVSYGLAPRHLSVAPRGLGFSLGGGLLLPVGDGARVRLEAQGMLFSQQMPANLAIRLTAGVHFGRR